MNEESDIVPERIRESRNVQICTIRSNCRALLHICRRYWITVDNYHSRYAVTKERSALIKSLVDRIDCIIDIAVRRNAVNSRSFDTAQHIVGKVEQILNCCRGSEITDHALVDLE